MQRNSLELPNKNGNSNNKKWKLKKTMTLKLKSKTFLSWIKPNLFNVNKILKPLIYSIAQNKYVASSDF